MYKHASYKEKYTILKNWIPMILDSIKKDIKNEHLKRDVAFLKKYLPGTNVNKVTLDDLVRAYERAIAEDEAGEELADFLTSRWLLKNTEVYDFFEDQLKQISDDFTTIEEIELPQAQKLTKTSTEQFGATTTYIFSVLNSVVFPKEIFQQLEKQAAQETKNDEEDSLKISEKMSIEKMKSEFEREVARLTDKYEKKLSGLQKKYTTDVEGYKKQIAQLQRKLKG